MRLSVRTVLVAGAAAWCLAIVAAPLLQLSPLYAFFSAICHQQSGRSWHIHGEALAVCVRCTAIYFGFLAGLLAIRTPHVRWFQFAAAATLAEWLLAVSIADIELLRALTGVLLGACAAPIVCIGVEQMLGARTRMAHES